MPDIHAGKGCTIGTTMTITDKVVPNLVGVDIGCGMETIRIREGRLELQKLDKLIYEKIPSGFSIREKAHRYLNQIDLNELCCAKHVDLIRAEKSIGTLGGGNHFIEVDKDDNCLLYTSWIRSAKTRWRCWAPTPTPMICGISSPASCPM